MERQRNTQILVIAVLSIAILTMSIGFAAFTTNLNINGNVNVAGMKWSVHFDTNASNTTVTEGSASTTKPTVASTTVTFEVDLDELGEFYEFTVPVVNDGDFDGALRTLTWGGVSEDQLEYLDIKATVNGTSYSYGDTDGSDQVIAKQTGVHDVTVRVEYLEPETDADVEKLPDEDQTVALTLVLTYDYYKATA